MNVSWIYVSKSISIFDSCLPREYHWKIIRVAKIEDKPSYKILIYDRYVPFTLDDNNIIASKYIFLKN